jgi:hypothetical protein
VLRFWSHESPIEAAQTIACTVVMADARHRVSLPHANEKT